VGASISANGGGLTEFGAFGLEVMIETLVETMRIATRAA
jgi:hypothetical protein